MNGINSQNTVEGGNFWKTFLRPWLCLQQLAEHASLFKRFASREVNAQYKGSVLGFAWMALSPLLMMCIYTFVFGIVFGARYESIHDTESSQWTYGLGLFLSLSFFQFFADTVSIAPQAIVAQPNLCKKVVFPLEVLPASLVAAAFLRFSVSLLLALIAIRVFNEQLPIETFGLLLTIPPLLLFSLGFAYALSALGVFIRDLTAITQFATLALMYASAVFYSASSVKDLDIPIWSVLKYNPLLHIIDLSRNLVITGRPFDWNAWSFTLYLSIACFSFGYALFRKLKPAFSDIL